MRCKICSNSNLKKIVETLRRDNFTYRDIQDYLLSKFHLKVSLGTISNHFYHIQEFKLPNLRPDEFILTKDSIDKITKIFMDTFITYVKDGDIVESFLIYFKNYKEPEPEIETNLTVYEDLKKIILSSPLPDNLKNIIFEEFSNKYFQMITEQETNNK
jgi:hypothetical protein